MEKIKYILKFILILLFVYPSRKEHELEKLKRKNKKQQ